MSGIESPSSSCVPICKSGAGSHFRKTTVPVSREAAAILRPIKAGRRPCVTFRLASACEDVRYCRFAGAIIIAPPFFAGADFAAAVCSGRYFAMIAGSICAM